MTRLAILGLASAAALAAATHPAASAGEEDRAASPWPAPAAENKPWTRWWWLGSAVDEKNLTRELEAFARAGIGGVEICPIYGAMGAEDRFIDFLSPEWMKMLAHTTREAKRLGMRVDLTTGTGWPFGGPMVGPAHSSKGLERIQTNAEGGKPISLDLPKGELQCLIAYPESGDPIDLTGFVKDGGIEWTPPPGKWTLSGISAKAGIQKVKRAAPGGEGFVLDPFSPASIEAYTAAFDKAFRNFKAPMPRAQFHDSFEYYGADWSPGLLDRFVKDRGYDLRSQLPAFNGKGDPDTVARVRADYRQTLGDMHRDYLKSWHDWSAKHGGITRNQAHGSPGNLLDHYAVSEIPETEIFRHVGEDQIPMLRFAASAAHASGGRLVSSETFTWLGEHFQVTPEALKEAADFVFLGGVNHLFFHGIPYSPDDAKWPGWLFYASTHMGPNGGLWQDLPAFNGYLQRCMSVLQDGSPDSEALIYFPFADTIASSPEKLPLFTIHNQNEWLHGTPFYQSAMDCWNSGITFDFASDLMLARATVVDGQIALGTNTFKALVIPAVKRMPVETMEQIDRLARLGARVIFHEKETPRSLDVPGFHDREKRKAALNVLRVHHLDKVTADLTGTLTQNAKAASESMTRQGLRFVRRKHAGGYSYFIVNRAATAFDGTLTLARPFQSAALLDPWNPSKIRILTTREIPLKLAPLESILIRTSSDRVLPGPAASAPSAATETLPIQGPWTIEFIQGGPSLPAKASLPTTAAWTTLADPAAANFSGTARYSTSFQLDRIPASGLRLDLGKVAHTARVILNGKPAGTSWCPPRVIDLGALAKTGRNELSIEVTNLAANRIADLDRRKVDWKRFHEINFVNIDYKPFDAATWPVMESGLIGPVQLITGP